VVFRGEWRLPWPDHEASGTGCSTNVRLYDSYPLLRSSALRCPSSSTRLSSDVQTAAAIFSLLNDYRLSNGKPPLGFLNPWLYGRRPVRPSTTSHLALTQAATLPDSPPLRGGILFVPRGLVSSFLTLLIPSPIGHRPRVAGLSKATNYETLAELSFEYPRLGLTSGAIHTERATVRG
jgi:hypothetical protein